jgi:glycerophosphoryl diester phosphodiesterase
MRNVVRALKAMIAVGAALTLLAPAAEAETLLEQIAVAHRGGAVTRFGEGTMLSYQDAAKNGAQILEGDIHWTKDSPNDSDSVGSIVIIHDSTLDRITNCSGKVSSWYWGSIRDKCYVNVGVKTRPRLIRINDLVAFANANSPRKTLAINLKNSTITNAQAKQLWRHLKKTKVHLHASWSNRAALNKVKALDRADPSARINYALSTGGDSGWPSVSTVKSFGTYLYAKKSIPASQMRTYKNNGIRVILWTGNDYEDYEEMTALQPYGVIVDDVLHFQEWRKDQI